MTKSKKERLAYMLSDAFPILHKKFCRDAVLPLPVNHFSTLVLLSIYEQMKISDISHGLAISKQQMSPIINRLDELNLIERINNTRDRRSCYVKLTAAGVQLLAKHRSIMANNLKNMLAVLNENELDDFVNSLNRCFELLQKI